jgi:serine/threonine-protein kinase
VLGQRYQIVREVGAGSFGTVYEARHVHTLRTVALKVLHSHTADDEATRERFRREVQAPAQIGHPGIVEVYDAHVDDTGPPFVAMRWLEGETLRAYFVRETPPLGRVLELFEQLLDALAAAHDAGFVHRDLKPDNVFVEHTEAGPAIRILDFGLARRVQATSITDTGTALGTPRYMSPEQFMNAKAAGPTADVWAVGAMLYEALSGEPPFRDRSSHALMLKVLTTPPTPLVDLAPHVPRTLAAVVERCLSKEQGDRPADARQLLKEIHTLRMVLAPTASVQPRTSGSALTEPTAPAWRPPADVAPTPSLESQLATLPRAASFVAAPIAEPVPKAPAVAEPPVSVPPTGPGLPPMAQPTRPAPVHAPRSTSSTPVLVWIAAGLALLAMLALVAITLAFAWTTRAAVVPGSTGSAPSAPPEEQLMTPVDQPSVEATGVHEDEASLGEIVEAPVEETTDESSEDPDDGLAEEPVEAPARAPRATPAPSTPAVPPLGPLPRLPALGDLDPERLPLP